MPTFEIQDVNGEWHRVTAPEGATREQLVGLASQPAGPAPPNMAEENFRRGAVQGLANVVEEPVRLAEHVTGTRLAPSFIREPASRFRKQAESTTEGRVGELVSSVGAGFIPDAGGLPAAARAAAGIGLPRVARALQTVRRWPGVRGAISAPLFQPVDPNAQGGDYARQKLEQAGAGYALPGLLGRFSRGSDLRTVAQAAEEARQPAARNYELYRWMLGPVGQAHTAPEEASGPNLAALQTRIGGELNRANAQLSFTSTPRQALAYRTAPTLQSAARENEWTETLENRLVNPLLRSNQIAGRDYADLLTTLRRQSEAWGRAGRANRPDSGDYGEMHRHLDQIIDNIERSAAGPPEAIAARNNAKNSYFRWSIVNDAADPATGSIASPSQVIREWSSREGAAAYRRNWDPMKQTLENWRQQLGEPAVDLDAARMPHGAREAAYVGGHALAGFAGGHVARSMLDAAAQQYGRVRGGLAAAGRAPGAVSAGVGQIAPEIDDSVTGQQ